MMSSDIGILNPFSHCLHFVQSSRNLPYNIFFPLCGCHISIPLSLGRMERRRAERRRKLYASSRKVCLLRCTAQLLLSLFLPFHLAPLKHIKLHFGAFRTERSEASCCSFSATIPKHLPRLEYRAGRASELQQGFDTFCAGGMQLEHWPISQRTSDQLWYS